MSLLERIHSPADLKSLTRPDLDRLAAEIRHVIIQTVARRAGHLAPNLGVVELTLALHRVFDSPRDKIIWDVGHQSYPHKLVTGRYEQFDTLRSLGGIRGYPARAESEHDPFGTCHGSTSISAALGFAVARDLKGEDFHVVAVIGDGALTGGMAFEGLNNAGEIGRRLIVILNDNEWSISPNVGAIARYLTRLTTHRFYRQIERDVYELLGRVPRLGKKAQEAARRIKEGLSNLVVPGVLFEELGFKYYGPLDGHDIGLLVHTLTELKEVPGPVHQPVCQSPSLRGGRPEGVPLGAPQHRALGLPEALPGGLVELHRLVKMPEGSRAAGAVAGGGPCCCVASAGGGCIAWRQRASSLRAVCRRPPSPASSGPIRVYSEYQPVSQPRSPKNLAV